ncbi:hypothetical protein [Nocardioides montaniterrae]
MRSMTGVVLSAVLALSLSACGSGDKAASSGLPTKKEYCQAARALTGHRPGPATIVEKVQDVGNDSPGEVAGSWHNIVQAVIIYAGVAKKAVRDPAHPPIGLNAAKTRALNKRLIETAWRTNVKVAFPDIRKVTSNVSSECGFKIAL